MIKKIKASLHEKLILTFLILLGIFALSFTVIVKNKCLFVKNFDPQKINFEKPNNIVVLNAECGNVIIELYPEISPNGVERFKKLADEKKYDGVVFHRVIDGFMAQTGDVQFGNSSNDNFDIGRAGTGGSSYPDLKAEFSDLPHERGTLSMARSSDPDSANSQFFICFKQSSFLDRQYTVFGKVVSGMEFVDLIKKGEGSNGEVNDPDKIVSLSSK